LDEGINAYDVVMNGLVVCKEILGDLYDKHEYFVPELSLCAEVLYGDWTS